MTNKLIAVIGANGQVGSQLCQSLNSLGEILAIDRSQLDLEDLSSIKSFLENLGPDLIINAAAYTAVDKAEVEQDKAQAINAEAPGLIAAYAASAAVPVIHYSTDYVFAGDNSTPYLETDPVSPQSIYGATKLQGEQAVANSGADHLIFRTSWVYGLQGSNFLLTMLRLFAERDELHVVNDQLGAPTSARAIAEATAQIVEQLCSGQAEHTFSEVSGLYHMTAAGQTSWFGFAEAILHYAQKRGLHCQLQPISTSDYPTDAARPAYSVLDNHKLNSVFGVKLPGWQEQLAGVMANWLKTPI